MTVFFHLVVDKGTHLKISRDKHSKNYVFGVFLDLTRIELVCEN
jgi:hypothetical protein